MDERVVYVAMSLCLLIHHVRLEPLSNSTRGQVSAKGSVPTAQEILGKLLGMGQKPAAAASAPAPAPLVGASAVGSPLQVAQGGGVYTTSAARSPGRPEFLLNNLPLIANGRQNPTPQTEDNPGGLLMQGYTLGLGYKPYGRRRRTYHYPRDDSDEDDEEPTPDDNDDGHNLADDEYDDYRGRGRGRQGISGRGYGRGRQEGGCGTCNICWKGIKPHVEWVKVPVCYHPCGICYPKHDDHGVCPSIPHCCCCHQCCCRRHIPCHHCCCHHNPCHCCRRSGGPSWRPPLVPRPFGL